MALFKEEARDTQRRITRLSGKAPRCKTSPKRCANKGARFSSNLRYVDSQLGVSAGLVVRKNCSNVKSLVRLDGSKGVTDRPARRWEWDAGMLPSLLYPSLHT